MHGILYYGILINHALLSSQLVPICLGQKFMLYSPECEHVFETSKSECIRNNIGISRYAFEFEFENDLHPRDNYLLLHSLSVLKSFDHISSRTQPQRTHTDT